MSIKEIVNLVDLDGKRVSTQYALDLASVTGSHVTGLATTVDPILPGYFASPLPAEFLEITTKNSEESVKNALNEFNKLAENFDVRVEGTSPLK